MRFLSTLSSQRLSLPISLFPSSREFCRESNVGKMVQPHNHIITCCHGCDKSITQNAGRNRNNGQSRPISFIPTILAGALLFGFDRQVYYPARYYPRFDALPPRFRPRLFPRCKFRVGIKWDLRYGAVYASNVEEAVTRRAIPEQHVALRLICSIGRHPFTEKEIRQWESNYVYQIQRCFIAILHGTRRKLYSR